MRNRLLIATVAALSLVGATAAGAQTTRSTLAYDNNPVRFSNQTYLPGQGGCVDDNGFGRLNACD